MPLLVALKLKRVEHGAKIDKFVIRFSASSQYDVSCFVVLKKLFCFF